ncbi:RNA-guided endonuclease TnpB family protein [Kribbella sp. NPDC059898]|uniref:RNA-guided endonuclease TnpB family protein n=1 Tax=Kribbella sp. NPDC059898 TaxID=3346995 RepID=UPI00365AD623
MDAVTRHTTFRYCLDPTAEQRVALARHTGAARFAFNQCLRLHLQARDRQRRNSSIVVPWSGFDLINLFNGWKKTEQAGRVFRVGADGTADVVVTGLVWRADVCQQVFEEAAADLGRALKSWTDSRRGKRAGARVRHPRFKKKDRGTPSFRLRNRHSGGGRAAIRVGEVHPRSVTLPRVGTVRVRDDACRLRRLLAKQRGRVLFATVSYRAGRWWVSLNVEASDLHPNQRHRPRAAGDDGGWVGVDRGLSALVVAGTSGGNETARVDNPPTPLAAGLQKQRRLARAVARKLKGSRNRRKAAARLGRHHYRVANVRKHFLHQVSNELVQTHDRLVIEDLHVIGMLRNRRLARAISDAAWTELARQLSYKQAWRAGRLVVADRWFPSSKTCSACGAIRAGLQLADRTFDCERCGHSIDRDLNAAVNLAIWAEEHHGADAQIRDHQAGGPVTKAHRQEGTGSHTPAGETGLDDVGTDGRGASVARTDDAREGRWRRSLTEAAPVRFKVLGDDHTIFA